MVNGANQPPIRVTFIKANIPIELDRNEDQARTVRNTTALLAANCGNRVWTLLQDLKEDNRLQVGTLAYSRQAFDM